MLCPVNCKQDPSRKPPATHTMTWVDVVIGLSGHSGAGKSALARGLAQRTGGEVVGFGDLVRETAESLGQDSSDRSILAEIGQGWAEDDPAGLAKAALDRAGSDRSVLILDGIRHLTVLRELKRLMPAIHLVFMKGSDELITKRLGGAYDPRGHPSEHDVGLLECEADIVLDAAAHTHELVDQVCRAVPLSSLNKATTSA
jgi:adenylate kinase family enzyme